MTFLASHLFASRMLNYTIGFDEFTNKLCGDDYKGSLWLATGNTMLAVKKGKKNSNLWLFRGKVFA